jgi:predicted ATPase
LATCIEHGFSYYRAWATILLGWTSAEEGAFADGIRQVGEGIHDLNATGAELRLPYYLGIQADLHCRSGELDEASAVLAKALAVAGRNGEAWYDPNLHLLQGELLLAASRPRPAEAAAAFRRASELARAQGSRALVLRAALRLGRLEADQGRRAEAYDLILRVYDGFTEGFDTADLKDAKALLDELA